MTAVHETTPDAPAPPPERRCPRCGSSLRPDQEWCLSCGAGLGAQVAAPRGWRWPLALVGGLLALLAIAIVLALVELAKDSETITPAATPAPTVAATPAPTTAAVPTATPTATINPSQVPPSSGGTAATPATAVWPAGKSAYTVMLDSATSLAAANARARDLSGQGIPAGVLDTSGYKPVTKDRYVIFTGQYLSRAEARTALSSMANRVTGARVAHIAPA